MIINKATSSVQQYLFNRSWSVTIGPQGGEGKTYTQLRTTFDIDKNSAGSSNKAKIELYNLTSYSRQQFQKGYVIQLLAGYSNQIQTLYLGDIARSFSERHGSEIVTVFECGDAERQLVYAHFDKSYPPGTKLTQIVFDLSTALKSYGVSLTQPIYTNEAASKSFGSGFAYSGTIKNALNKLLPGVGMEWSIQNNYLQIIPVRHHTGDTAILINKSTGMVGVPSQGVGFVQFQCLLNPKINVGSIIALQSQTVNGIFKVRRAHFQGDSHSTSKWIADCEAVRINQNQSFLTDQGTNFQVIA